MPAKSYLSQSELPVTFGLGFAERMDEVTITWPGGIVQKLSGLRLDALNVVTER
jgi:enediyne biosynthesis protein E4